MAELLPSEGEPGGDPNDPLLPPPEALPGAFTDGIRSLHSDMPIPDAGRRLPNDGTPSLAVLATNATAFTAAAAMSALAMSTAAVAEALALATEASRLAVLCHRHCGESTPPCGENTPRPSRPEVFGEGDDASYIAASCSDAAADAIRADD